MSPAARDRIGRISGRIAEWSLYILIFALPFSKSLIEIAAAVGIVAVALRKTLLRQRIVSTPVNGALMCIFAAAALSVFNSGYLALSMKALISKSLKHILLFVVVVETIDTKEKIGNVAIMAVLSGIVVVIDGFVQYYVTHLDFLHFPPYQTFSYDFNMFSRPYPSYLGFPTASFPFPNDFAAWILILIFPVGIASIAGGMPWARRTVTAFLFAAMGYLFLLTKARSAWLGFVVGLIAIPCFDKRLRKAMLIILLVTLLSPAVIQRSYVKDIVSLSSISDRKVMWENGWKIFKRHPVAGNGINTFFREYMNIRQDEWRGKRGSYAHNCFLQMMADTGIIGLGAFLFLLIRFFSSVAARLGAMRDRTVIAVEIGLLCGISAFLVQSFFDTNLYSLNLAMLFWFSLGMAEAAVRVGSGAVT